MKFVLITRPEPQAQLLAAHLAIPCFCEPILTSAPLSYVIDWEGITDVILTSTRVLDYVDTLPPNLRYWCVGQKTAEAAHTRGLSSVIVGPGNVEALLQNMKAHLSPDSHHFLYLKGKEVTLEIDQILAAAGFQIQSIPVYEMIPRLRLSAELKTLLHHGQIVIAPFYSWKTAETFRQLITQSELTQKLKTITALALSDKIAQSLKQLPWQKIEVNHNLVKSIHEAYNQLEDEGRNLR
jgi:uroporphyrinogen-III synthase